VYKPTESVSFLYADTCIPLTVVVKMPLSKEGMLARAYEGETVVPVGGFEQEHGTKLIDSLLAPSVYDSVPYVEVADVKVVHLY
jgi:hypothetical protein